MNMNLAELGLDKEMLAVVREVSSKPFGMVLATGPVGSGKTTTLYSCLNEFDRTERHIMSIEDPVEISLEGANQVEVNYSLGFDFVRGLRALLRQDPDTILIGEIRDEETARIAVRASMTGLMVLSTLHANESTGAVTTLRNFNIPSFLIANSLKGVIAQRLLRRICDNCKTKHSITQAEIEASGLTELPKGFKAWEGKGCNECLGSGYRGRIGVFEILEIDSTVRDLIQEEGSERMIRNHALSVGLRTIQQDGLKRIAAGKTTLEEYRRVLRF
jgi:general secretion pathway protein E